MDLSYRSGWQNAVWSNQEALAYSRALDSSDYVQQIIPCIQDIAIPLHGRDDFASPASKGTQGRRYFGKLLDVGAGDGRFAQALTSCGAHIDAIEPSVAMRRLMRSRLRHRSLNVWSQPWWQMPDKGRYHLGFAANISAFGLAPLTLYRCMRPRCQRMVWVVPAQKGPSSFCLSGFVVKCLRENSYRPRYEVVLDALGGRCAPRRVNLCNWTFRRRYRDWSAAVKSLQESLIKTDVYCSSAELRNLVFERGVFDVKGRVTLGVAKRSAVMQWF